MNNAALLIQSRKAKRSAREARLNQRKTANLPSVIREPSPRIFSMIAPPGGFSTTTVRQQNIVAEIAKNPKLTPREYADRLLVLPKEVNDAILYSRDARMLAEQGLVSISDRGRVPRWANLCSNKQAIMIRKRQPQIVAVSLPRLIQGDNRAALNEAISTMQDIIISTSNRRMKSLLDKAVEALIKSGKSYAAMNVQNKLLTASV